MKYEPEKIRDGAENDLFMAMGKDFIRNKRRAPTGKECALFQAAARHLVKKLERAKRLAR